MFATPSHGKKLIKISSYLVKLSRKRTFLLFRAKCYKTTVKLGDTVYNHLIVDNREYTASLLEIITTTVYTNCATHSFSFG